MLSPAQLALMDALERRKLLVCVGPLVSIAAGLASPVELVQRCRQRLAALGPNTPTIAVESGVAAALERAEALLGSATFVRLVREAWEAPVPVSGVARALVGLSPGLNGIITTNLDRLLERAFEGRWFAIDEAAPDVAKRTRVIFKVRGTIDQPTRWMLTARQQENASFFGAMHRRELEALLRSHILLFVGFPPDDEELRRLLEVRGHPVADKKRSSTETLHPDLALVPEAVWTDHARDQLGQRGVEVVPLAGDYDAQAARYLGTLAEELGRRTQRPVPTIGSAVEPAEPSKENPYPGLEPFTEKNRRYFFGREDDLSRVLSRLGTVGTPLRQWVFVDGPSGVGKSSFLHAGLLPALRDGGAQIPGPAITWRIVTMRPGPAPVFELAEQVHRILVGDAPCELSASSLGARLQHATAALGEFLGAHLGEGEGVVLLVDQLEEALRAQTAEARDPFAAALADLLVRSPRPLLLITSLRSDFSGDLPRLPALHERMTGASPPVRYTLAALSRAQLASAIEGPAREARVELAEGLTERMIADAGHIERGEGHSGEGNPETALPLVAAVVASLYEKRDGRQLTHAAYDAMGKVAGALTRRGDEALAPLLKDFTDEQLWGLFRKLVDTAPQGRTTRRALSRSDALAAVGGGPKADTLLARLTGSKGAMRLVVAHGNAAAPQIDLVHDALLRGWAWLREHIDRDRVELLRESELADTAARWDRHGRPAEGLPSGAEAEYFLRASTSDGTLGQLYQNALRRHLRRRRTVLHTVIAVLVGGILTLSGVSVYAWYQRGEAQAQTQLARERLKSTKVVTNDLLFEVLPRLNPIPGTTEVRKEIHRRLETMQQTLRIGAGEDAELLRLEMAQSISRGELALHHEQLDQARVQLEHALALAEHLVEEHRGPETQRDLTVSLNHLGDVEKQAGNLAAAQAFFARSLQVREGLAGADPTSAQAQRDLTVSLDRLGDVEMEVGNLATAEAHLDRSLLVRENLAGADPTSAQAQRDLAVSLEKLGNVAMQAGDLEGARAHLDRSLRVLEGLARADPTSAQAQRDLSVSLDRLGDVEMQAGNLAAARAHANRSLHVSEGLARADPTSAQAPQRVLPVSLDRPGSVEMQAGSLAVRGHVDRSFQGVEGLAEADPTNALDQLDLAAALNQVTELSEADSSSVLRAWTQVLSLKRLRAYPVRSRHLSVPLDRVWDVEMQTGNLVAARAHFDRSLQVREDLAWADPASAQAQRDLAVSHDKLGSMELQAGNVGAARAHFGRSLQVFEDFTNADPTIVQAQRDLSISLDRLGDVEVEAGNLAAARVYFDRSLRVAEGLATADPTSAQAQRDLAVSLENLGNVEMEAKNLAAARAHFDRSLHIQEGLARTEPTSAQAQRGLAVSLEKVGDVEMEAGNLPVARTHVDRSLQVREALARADPTSAQAQRNLSVALEKLGDVEMKAGHPAAALAHFDRSLQIAEGLARADSTSARASFEIVVSHCQIAQIAMQSDQPDFLRRHLDIASVQLTEMDLRGHVAGFTQREQVRKWVQDAIAELSPRAPRK